MTSSLERIVSDQSILSTNWPIMRLGELADVASGGTPKVSDSSFWTGDIPWYSSGELNDYYTVDPERCITTAGLKASSAKIFPAGSLLVGMYDTAALKMSILDRPGTFNQAIAGVKPNSNMDLLFILHQINWRRDSILALRRGVRQKNLNLSKIREIEINLPPLSEQQRIADILDRAEALRAKRRAALAQLDELKRSLFREMFGDPVANPKRFKAGTIDDIVGAARGNVRCGPFGTQLKVHEIVSQGIPLLGIENVLNNKFVEQSTKFLTPAKARELTAFDVKPHDVLITRMGTIGRACVVPPNFEEGRFSYHLFRIRPDQTKCLSAFLSATISDSGTFQSQLQSMSHGAIMAGLNTTDLRRVKFLIPPLPLQQQFALRVQAIERLKAKHRQSLAELDALFLSLQHRAFRGEL